MNRIFNFTENQHRFGLWDKSKPEKVLYLVPEEEGEIWYNIENDERMSSKEVRDLLICEENE
ncbi:MAG: hypothetical protein M0P77_10560 [Firmicutes bacterium]|nr:hypothetical protein [Bacillota bacterium]